MLATILFAGFIAFLYLPSQFFRFAANLYADLRRRRSSSQLEDFFGASIPSLILNVVALVVWGAGSNATAFIGRDWMPPPDANTVYSVLAALTSGPASDELMKEHKATLLHALPWLGLYWTVVMAVGVLLGLWYGKTEHSLAREGGVDAVKVRYPTWGVLWNFFWNPPVYGSETIRRQLTARHAAEKFAWFFRLLFHRVWDLCFFSQKNFIYPWAATNSRVFLKMKPGHIVFGILKSYVHSNDGGVEGILLRNVQRFDAETLKETALAGKNPFRKLVGPLFVKWDEVLDVNFPPPGHMKRLRRLYLRIYRHARKKAVAHKHRSLMSRMWRRSGVRSTREA